MKAGAQVSEAPIAMDTSIHMLFPKIVSIDPPGQMAYHRLAKPSTCQTQPATMSSRLSG